MYWNYTRSLRTYIPTYLRTYASTHTCMHTYVHTYRYIHIYILCMHAYMHTYIHTYMRTHTYGEHTRIFIYIYIYVRVLSYSLTGYFRYCAIYVPTCLLSVRLSFCTYQNSDSNTHNLRTQTPCNREKRHLVPTSSSQQSEPEQTHYAPQRPCPLRRSLQIPHEITSGEVWACPGFGCCIGHFFVPFLLVPLHLRSD